MLSVLPASVIPHDCVMCQLVHHQYSWWIDAILALDGNGKLLPFTPQGKINGEPIDTRKVQWPEGTAYNVALMVVPDKMWWRDGQPFGSLLLRQVQMIKAGWTVQIVSGFLNTVDW